MTRFPYDHENCPNCLNRDARETTGMVCQSCGHDYAPDATVQDPPELESLPDELTPRDWAMVAVHVALGEFNASRDDGDPEARIPLPLRETIVDAVWSIVVAHLLPHTPVTTAGAVCIARDSIVNHLASQGAGAQLLRTVAAFLTGVAEGMDSA